MVDTVETKKWYASKGVWGSVLAIGAGAAGIFGYTIDADMQVQAVELLAAGGSVVGGLIALVGRLLASKAIG